MSYKKVQPRDCLYSLLWADCVDRLDILILEIRHLQQSIIHSLREPLLYSRLATEEEHLWGANWEPHLFDSHATPAGLAAKWIRLFPGVKSKFRDNEQELAVSETEIEGDDGTEEWGLGSAKTSDEPLRQSIYALWFEGKWGREQRRQYHTLRALQSLKRQILADKIMLAREAFKANIHKPSLLPQEAISDKARFAIVRSIVLIRARDYLYHLNDHRQQFISSLDAGLHDHPRPMVTRRRELGVYSDFLSDKTRDLSRDINILLNKLKMGGGELVEPRQRSPSGLILHRWTHYPQSDNSSFKDEVGCSPQAVSYAPPGQAGSNRLDVDFVNTHYWMAERPDLMPIIVHEVAHSVIRDRCGNLRDYFMAESTDEMTDLLVKIFYVFIKDEKWKETPSETPLYDPVGFIKELACDLISTSIKGHAYLYALFMDAFATTGVYDLVESMDERFEIGLNSGPNEEVDFSAGITKSSTRDWYFRIKLVSIWLKAIHHREGNGEKRTPAFDSERKQSEKELGLDDILIRGINTVLSETSRFLDKHSVDEAKWNATEARILRDVGRLIEKSGVAKSVREWRIERSTDNWEDDGLKGKRLLPRSMSPLQMRVREFLYESLRELKTQDGKALESVRKKFELKKKEAEESNEEQVDSDEASRAFDTDFEKAYGVKPPGNSRATDSPLFRHHYDIPWQCAIMRGIDLIRYGKRLGDSPVDEEGIAIRRPDADQSLRRDVLRQVHYDSALGRELYELGMEFYFRNMETAPKRLMTCVGLIKKLCADTQDQPMDSTGVDALERWIHGEELLASYRFPAERRHDEADAIAKYLVDKEHTSGSLQHLASIESALKNAESPTTYSEEGFGSQTSGIGVIGAETILTTAGFVGRHRYPKESRIVERLAGQKLDQLYQMLCRYHSEIGRQFDSRLQVVKSYLGLRGMRYEDYLQSYSAVQHADDCCMDSKGIYFSTRTSFSQELVDSLSDFRENVGASPWRNPRLDTFMIGRISIAGSFDRPGNGEAGQGGHMSIGEVLSKNEWRGSDLQYWPPDSRNGKDGPTKNPIRYQTLLGRYDGLSIYRTRPMCRCGSPEFDNASHDKYPTFFTRRELGLPFQLGVQGCGERALLGEHGRKPILGLIAVVLQRRTYRLDFLYRLRLAIKRANEGENRERQSVSDVTHQECFKTIEEAAHLFMPDDFAFLTDGWGDILLVFMGEPVVDGIDRLSAIYELQNSIYHDFMTDRTEVILTPPCFDHAVRQWWNPEAKQTQEAATNVETESILEPVYDISTHVRTLEDRMLSSSNQNFVKSVHDKFKNNFGHQAQSATGIKSIKTYRIPGRMDFSVMPDKRENPSGGSREGDFSSYTTWIKCIDTDQNVDRISTRIGKIAVSCDPDTKAS